MNRAKLEKVTLVAGARPNFVKIAPVHRALAGVGLTVRLVHTGQHYDEAMSEAFFRDLGIPAPDADLGVGSGSHGIQTGAVLKAFEADLIAHPADAIVVVGDVNSTLAASLAAVKLGVKVAHVEAGLRSFDRSMPEEINRLLTDRISDWLFVTEDSGLENLKAEGIPGEKIFLVGNVMIDSLEASREAWQKLELPAAARKGSYGVMTLHRPSNVDDAGTLRGILEAVADLGKRLPVVFPVHPRTEKNIHAFGLEGCLESSGGIRPVPPMGYLEFLNLFSGADIILTDSGGAQEEALVLGIPCVTLRDSTESPVTLEMGRNRLVGSDPARIRAGIEEALGTDRSHMTRPKFWDGRAADRIARILIGEEGK